MFHISTQLKVTIGFFALLLLIGLSVGLVYHEMSTSMENKQHEMAHIDSMRAKIMKKDLQIEEALQTVKTVYTSPIWTISSTRRIRLSTNHEQNIKWLQLHNSIRCGKGRTYSSASTTYSHPEREIPCE
jgi:O6-methylguanine-DNA--protein-cysteine methyltransferase